MIILASASPRRQELMKLVTEEFMVRVSDIDEQVNHNKPDCVVKDLARQKAEAVFQQYPDDVIIGCDTIVSIHGKIMGKPKDETEAYSMLNELSGNIHQVYTGVCIISSAIVSNFAIATDVEFMEMSDREIKDYIATGEPFDKAGAYGIQGLASKFVSHIDGDYFNIVGLPVNRVYKELKKYDLL